MARGNLRISSFTSRIVLLSAVLALLASAASATAWGDPSGQSPAPQVTSTESSPTLAARLQTETLVRYRVRFVGTWTTDSLASSVSIPSGAHFTTLVGAAHSSSVIFWERGGTASDGIEDVAELGITADFSSEVSAAITASTAREYISASLGFGPTPNGNDFFEVSESFPLITLISMVAPSPDWFVGVSGLSLREGGEWVTRKEVELYPYDAGTEDGTEFSLNNPATSPQGVITSIRNTGKFSNRPLAMLVFDRWEPVLSVEDASAEEGDTVDFTVTLNRRSITPAQQVTVQYATLDGTAADGTDYTAASGTLAFGVAETAKTVSVATTADSTSEDDETLTLTLSSPTNALLLDAEATGTIGDSANLAPQFDAATTTRSVDENTRADIAFDTPVAATDGNGDRLTYSLSGPDAGSFRIEASSGQLRTWASLDYEDRSSYSVTVTATDPDSATDTIAVTVLVNNVDEEGTVTLSPPALMGTTVTAALEDPDGAIIGTAWAWQRSEDRNTWATVIGAASATYTPVAADVGHYLRATASYTDGQGTNKTARATTANRVPNRPPAFGASAAERSVDENTPVDTAFDAAVSATDADGHNLTYTLGGTHAASFDIDTSSGQLRTEAVLDYESRQSYSVRVTAEDDEGATDSINVTIRVGNVDEPGTVTLSSGVPAAGTALTARLADPDGGVTGTAWMWHSSSNLSTWTLIDGPTAAAYTPQDSDTGLYLRATASYRDGEGSGKSAEAESANPVQAAPVPNRAPEFGSTSISRSVDENTRTGVDFGAAVTADDLDSDTLEYTLGGTDASSFGIDSSTGQLRTVAALNYENRQSYTVTITAEDPGGATDSVQVTIDIVNVNEDGTVTLSAIRPMMGTALTARLSDLDGGVTGTTWTWQRSTNEFNWMTISGAESATYTPQTADIGNYLRAVASYSDGHDSGKTARAAWPDRVLAAENQPPEFASTAVERSVAENSRPGTAVGDPVTADDPENDSLLYSLAQVGSAPFEINADTGQIAVADGAALDYERRRSYPVTVAVSDGKGTMGGPDNSADDTVTVTIRVTDVDDGSPRPGPVGPVGPGPVGPVGPGPVGPAEPEPEPEEFESAFTDIETAGVHRAAVESLERQGLFEDTECAADSFCPGDPILRWTAAVWLVRLLDGADADPQGQVRFADVDPGMWWAPFVERLAELEVTTGCRTEPELIYCPSRQTTRAQMASFLSRALELPAAEEPAGFADVAADSVHAGNIDNLYTAGITTGCRTEPELIYCPSRQTTRAQMASFIHRSANYLASQADEAES